MMDIYDDTYIEKLLKLREEESKLLERLIAERKYLAETIKLDPLTGLYNRRILPKIREIGTVIMCDIDDFKNVNDTYGHDVGDKVIKAVGHTILDNIRIGDVACRFGGDEFLIVFTTDREDVIDERMRKIAEDVNNELDIDFDVTLSVGVAFNKNNEDLETLMEKADDALYQSKENGKNQISYYGKEKVLVKRKEI